MEKTMNYRRIYGCPKHGSTNGTKATLKTNNNGIEVKKPCYRCETCKKVYLEPYTGTMGDTKRKVQNYAIWNTVGPFPLQSAVYLYDKSTEKGCCSCLGKIKKKTKTITHVLLRNGKTESLPGTKVCLHCNRVFITDGIFKSHQKFFDENDITVINYDEDEGNTANQSDLLDISKDRDKKQEYK